MKKSPGIASEVDEDIHKESAVMHLAPLLVGNVMRANREARAGGTYRSSPISLEAI